MPPPAVEFPSPMASTHPTPSSPFPNATHKPSENRPSVNSSNAETASEFAPNGTFATPNASRPGSAAPGRSRPRLVKVRRQVGSQQARSRNVPSETDSGFNPFRSVSVGSQQARSRNVPSETDSGFNPFRSVSVSYDGVSNASTAFPVFSDSVVGGPSVPARLKFSNVDAKFENNMGFVFSAKKDDSALNLNSGDRESGGNVGVPGSDDRGDINNHKESESSMFENVGFVFGSKQGDPISDSFADKGQSSKNGWESVFSDKGKMKMEAESECTKFGSAGLMFTAGADIAAGKVERGAETVIETGKSGYGKMENGDKAEFRKCGDQSFMFDDTGSNTASNSNLEESKFSGNIKQTVLDHREAVEVETEAEFNNLKFAAGSSNSDYGHEKGAFVFDSSNLKDSIFHGNSSEKLSVSIDEMNNGKMQDDNLGSDSIHTNTFVFGSSRNGAGAFSSKPQCTLPDEMKKLNISNCGNVDDSEKAKDSSMNSCKHNELKSVFGSVCEETPIRGVGMENISSFTMGPDGLGVPFADFDTPRWDPSGFKANIFPEANKKLDFSAKSRSVRDKRFKKKKGKLRQPSVVEHSARHNQVPHESGLQENSDSAGCYSPMDFSPYQETTTADQSAGEIPVTSNESSHLDMKCGPSTLGTTNLTNEDLATPRENLYDRIGDQNQRKQEARYHHEQWFAANPRVGETVSGAETTVDNPIMGEFCSNTSIGVASAGDRDDSCSNARTQETDGKKLFTFAPGLDDLTDKKFSFCASSSVQSSSPTTRRRLRRKSRAKVGCDSFVITPSSNVKFESSSLQFSTQPDGSLHFDTTQGQKNAPQDKGENKREVNEQVKKGSVPSNATIQEICEKWRLRGNQAYKNGYLPKAEEYYTRGVNSVSYSERSGSCLKPLVLCYSNRAATRMSLGRIREALEDCTIAATLDPNFLKVQMRAANCHLLLGEVENALQCFNKCVESGGHVCLDRRLMVEAAEGLQKTQKVSESTERSAKLLEQKTSDAALRALEIIAESLSISLYSEELLKMKAEALSLLRRNEEVIQLCEQTLPFAEKNFASVGTHIQSANVDGSTCERSSLGKLWRWFFITKSYFYMGRLETALDRLEKLEQFGTISDKLNILESSISLGVTIRELLHRKNAGNEAFKSGRYSEAIEHYTVALSSNVESRPFAAICFCNRAAAHQALGQIADAIADCSLSLALDANYAKAVSRRATLHEMIRDYDQAASDLQRLVSILENQNDERVKSPATESRSSGDARDLRQAHRRMSLMEEEAKKGNPLDIYKILGIKQSDSASDIKKAYHKAALRHHPDKAGQFLAKSESGDEGQLWKEIAQEVYKDADRLFKMIGEAYAILSDPSKRSEYDLEEELRNFRKSGNGSGTSSHRKASDAYSKYPFERSGNRRYWQESWKTYGTSYSRW